ncbi:MAG: FAD-binding oxidoreductase [bacterium]|nr:FAD-binding oxidoreductase [bacterium]
MIDLFGTPSLIGALAALTVGAVIALRRRHVNGRTLEQAAAAAGGNGRIVPDAPVPIPDSDAESLDVWGFRDTRFEVNERGHVELVGARYELSGQELPSLVPWVLDVMGAPLKRDETNRPAYPPEVPAPRSNAAFDDELRGSFKPDQLSTDAALRLRHGHGHTQEEMWAIKHGSIDRVPDLVVYPEDEEQVVRLVAAAARHAVCLIPYGGGTNVTEALRCPKDEQRTIVSVDMTRMNRVLWIDPVNRQAFVQAGAPGRLIMEQLEQHGFTMGHEPDSVEFSTLGGWVATNASGMKKNRYGNIEDIVLDVHLVTPAGKLERATAFPRESVGADPRLAVLGSEGNIGIITGAVVKLFPLPEVQRYGSVVFPSFEEGVAFLYDLMHSGRPPASVRLVDNLQFQFSMALKPGSTGLHQLKSRAQKWFVTRIKGFDPQKMVACTLVFEGDRSEVREQEERVYRVARAHNGMKAGAENGRRGYQLTFSIAYIRDFIMNHYLIGESFETSVPWSHVLTLCENVKRRVLDECAQRNLPGKPFISCRVTQLYETGVCVYFYFGYYYKGVDNPSEIYAEMENAARDEILRSGGSLSHHHGIGKLRESFLPRVMSEASLEMNRRTKRAFDPDNIFGVRNQGIGS